MIGVNDCGFASATVPAPNVKASHSLRFIPALYHFRLSCKSCFINFRFRVMLGRRTRKIRRASRKTLGWRFHVNDTNPSGSPLMLGLFQQMPLPAVSRYLARQGWKWIVLDLQHGPMNYETAYECIHTLRAYEAQPYVRVSVEHPTEIQKLLDLGAAGIVVPMVNSKEQAQAAAYAAKYPPLGGRSKGGDLDYLDGEDYPTRANRDTKLLVQIEHVDAVRSVEKILKVDGVDGCFMGQVDLAMSMGLGHRNFKDDEEHRKGIQRSVDVCNKLGKFACYNAFSVEEAEERVRQGFRGVTFRSDVDWLLNATGSLLAEVRGKLA